MRVLLGCEESQAVCIEFRKRGHEAYSCDLRECSGGFPEWHIQDDLLKVIKQKHWDMMICFPPCTFLSGVQLFRMKNNPERQQKMKEAKQFVMDLWNCHIKKIGLENPVGILNTTWKRPTQIIHPWYFGDNEMKRTCLWLKNLPRLMGLVSVAQNIEGHKPKPYRSFISAKGKVKNVYFANDTKNIRNGVARSKTFPGIAKAMAVAWSDDLGNKWNL